MTEPRTQFITNVVTAIVVISLESAGRSEGELLDRYSRRLTPPGTMPVTRFAFIFIGDEAMANDFVRIITTLEGIGLVVDRIAEETATEHGDLIGNTTGSRNYETGAILIRCTPAKKG